MTAIYSALNPLKLLVQNRCFLRKNFGVKLKIKIVNKRMVNNKLEKQSKINQKKKKNG